MEDPQPSAAPERLKRRAEFLHAAKGKRFHARGFTLQAALRRDEADRIAASAIEQPAFEPSRFGFTVTKKIGGAVLRNRIRRRLKEAVRRLAPLPARRGYDYVLVARIEALGMAFSAVQAELVRALGKIDAVKSKKDMPEDKRRRGAPPEGGETGRRSEEQD
ncbi:MAG: ribonuclease P protein component [Methylocella sp.]